MAPKYEPTPDVNLRKLRGLQSDMLKGKRRHLVARDLERINSATNLERTGGLLSWVEHEDGGWMVSRVSKASLAEWKIRFGPGSAWFFDEYCSVRNLQLTTKRLPVANLAEVLEGPLRLPTDEARALAAVRAAEETRPVGRRNKAAATRAANRAAMSGEDVAGPSGTRGSAVVDLTMEPAMEFNFNTLPVAPFAPVTEVAPFAPLAPVAFVAPVALAVPVVEVAPAELPFHPVVQEVQPHDILQYMQNARQQMGLEDTAGPSQVTSNNTSRGSPSTPSFPELNNDFTLDWDLSSRLLENINEVLPANMGQNQEETAPAPEKTAPAQEGTASAQTEQDTQAAQSMDFNDVAFSTADLEHIGLYTQTDLERWLESDELW